MTAPALLVDYGGVLTTSVMGSFRAFARGRGLDPDAFLAALGEVAQSPDDLFGAIETGRIPLEAFEHRLAERLSERLGTAVPAAALDHGLFAAMGEDPAMTEALLAARRAGIPTGLVSNSWGADGYPRERFGDLFDAVVISGEVGLRKPEPDIYLLAASLVGAEPSRCVFVDDLQVNVDGAAAVGMRGVLHRSAEETLPTLERLLGVGLA